jgi:transcriptional regulator of NAD metabolism
MIDGLEHTPRIADQAEHLAEPARLSRKGQRARERREELVRLLRTAREPIVGAELARRVGVSRQMLTHDLTLLRLSGVDIMATRYGYMLRTPELIQHRDVLHVQHDRGGMVEEMTILVDLGIRILDVGIDHPVYGPLRADLSISSRHDVGELVAHLEQTGAAPLCEITGGRHSHTVEAPRPDLLAKAREQLRERGYIRDSAPMTSASESTALAGRASNQMAPSEE